MGHPFAGASCTLAQGVQDTRRESWIPRKFEVLRGVSPQPNSKQNKGFATSELASRRTKIARRVEASGLRGRAAELEVRRRLGSGPAGGKSATKAPPKSTKSSRSGPPETIGLRLCANEHRELGALCPLAIGPPPLCLVPGIKYTNSQRETQFVLTVSANTSVVFAYGPQVTVSDTETQTGIWYAAGSPTDIDGWLNSSSNMDYSFASSSVALPAGVTFANLGGSGMSLGTGSIAQCQILGASLELSIPVTMNTTATLRDKSSSAGGVYWGPQAPQIMKEVTLGGLATPQTYRVSRFDQSQTFLNALYANVRQCTKPGSHHFKLHGSPYSMGFCRSWGPKTTSPGSNADWAGGLLPYANPLAYAADGYPVGRIDVAGTGSMDIVFTIREQWANVYDPGATVPVIPPGVTDRFDDFEPTTLHTIQMKSSVKGGEVLVATEAAPSASNHSGFVKGKIPPPKQLASKTVPAGLTVQSHSLTGRSSGILVDPKQQHQSHKAPLAMIARKALDVGSDAFKTVQDLATGNPIGAVKNGVHLVENIVGSVPVLSDALGAIEGVIGLL